MVKKKNPHAVTLGRAGGRKSGKARMEKLTTEQRKAIARKPVQARWAKGSIPGLSRAKRRGKMLGRPRPILYIEDSGGCYSDLPLFSSLCPQLVIGKTVGSGHFATLEVPEQVNSMIEDFIEAYSKNLKGPSSLRPTSS